MPRKQKTDYAAMFSFNEETGLYYAKRTKNGISKQLYAKDPKILHDKIQAFMDAPEPKPTFRQVAEAWQEKKWEEIRPKTQECYTAPLRRAINEYGDRPIEEITSADVNRIILRMKDRGFASQTVKDQKAVLNMIFNYAISSDPPMLQINPCAAVKVPRGLPKKKRLAPDDEDLHRILSMCDRAEFGLFPYLLAHTGCRRGEALALTWGDIDRKKGEIRITKAYSFQAGKAVLGDPKTESGKRTIPLLPQLALRLARPKGVEDGDLIFHDINGNPLCDTSFKRRWLSFCRDVGMIETVPEEKKGRDGRTYIHMNTKPTVTPHQFRHAFATFCLESGIDAKAAQLWLGHSDVHTTTQTYQEIRERQAKNESNKLMRYLSENYG